MTVFIMKPYELISVLIIAFIIGYSTATFCQSEPLTDVSQYEVATPIYSH